MAGGLHVALRSNATKTKLSTSLTEKILFITHESNLKLLADLVADLVAVFVTPTAGVVGA